MLQRHPWVNTLSISAVSVSDEARAEVNGLKASRFFSLAEQLNAGSTPFIWLFIRPPWSVSGSCCKAVVHESLRAECQLQGVNPVEEHAWGPHAGRSEPHRVSGDTGRCKARHPGQWRCRKLRVWAWGQVADEPAGQEISELVLPGSHVGGWARNAGPRLPEAQNQGAVPSAAGVQAGATRTRRWGRVAGWNFLFRW